jgi:hypothetical protein
MYEHKSEGITILLAVIPSFIGIYGLGHFYVGKIAKGILWLICGFLVELISIPLTLVIFVAQFAEKPGYEWLGLFLIPCFAFWVWHIYDARHVCRKHNLGLP